MKETKRNPQLIHGNKLMWMEFAMIAHIIVKLWNDTNNTSWFKAWEVPGAGSSAIGGNRLVRGGRCIAPLSINFT